MVGTIYRSKFNTALGIESQGFCVIPVGDQRVRPPSR